MPYATDPAQAEYARTCPTCHAAPGQPCRSVLDGYYRALRDSHRARRESATDHQED
jgi:hypothetical protein